MHYKQLRGSPSVKKVNEGWCRVKMKMGEFCAGSKEPRTYFFLISVHVEVYANKHIRFIENAIINYSRLLN